MGTQHKKELREGKKKKMGKKEMERKIERESGLRGLQREERYRKERQGGGIVIQCTFCPFTEFIKGPYRRKDRSVRQSV